jgi:predicted transcriptional regulator
VETRQLARLMGSLSFEERLLIMDALVSTGEIGMNQMELAEITSLSQSSVGINLEYMMSTDIVRYRSESAGKVFFANFDLLENLFLFMNKNYGAGLGQAIRGKLGSGLKDRSP